MNYAAQNPKLGIGVQGLFDISSTQKLPLGSRVQLGDGRDFVYVKNSSAAALSPAKLCQSSAPISDMKELAFVSRTLDIVGKYTILNVTLGSTAATANEFADGYACIVKGTGLGQIFKIRSNPAAASGTLALQLYDEILTAPSASDSKITLIKHPCMDVIVTPTTAITAPILGVPLVTITESYYGWLQQRGICPILTDADSAVVIGFSVMPSVETAGAVEVTSLNSVDTAGQQPVVGVIAAVQEDAEYSLIDLKI